MLRLFLIGFATVLLASDVALAQKCASFSTCAEAVQSLKSGNTKLDGDKDGIPCEKLCGKNGENMPQ